MRFRALLNRVRFASSSATVASRYRGCDILLVVLNTIRVLAHNGPVVVELARWRGRLVVTKRVLGVPGSLAERLRREAEVAARLDHENIVPLLGVEDDVLVYAYSPGVTLSELVNGSTVPHARALDLMEGILAALEFAHSHGIIHLDVKPGNILIRGRRALLTDFGFAKDLALAAITAEHSLLGTPGYMAPEQFRGVRDDPRSDIFSAAAVLWHMLAGDPPFGRNALRFLVGDDVEHSTSPDDLPAGTGAVLVRALSRDPADRFGTIGEFQAALARTRPPQLA